MLDPYSNDTAESVRSEIEHSKDELDRDYYAELFGISKSSKNIIQSVINQLRPLPKERAVVINSQGKIVWQKDGGHDFVPLRELEHKDLEGAIFLHNHPSGVSLSVDDVGSACALRFAAVYAIGKTGYTYLMEPPKGDATFEPKMWPAIQKAGGDADSATRQAFVNGIKKNKLDPDDANIDHWHVVLSYIALRTGLRYSRTGKGSFELPQIKAVHPSHIPVYDKNGVSPKYPPSKDLTHEAGVTFSLLHQKQEVSPKKPAKELTSADVDTPHGLQKGGSGSGNFGHEGRQGEVGGSGASSGVEAYGIDSEKDYHSAIQEYSEQGRVNVGFPGIADAETENDLNSRAGDRLYGETGGSPESVISELDNNYTFSPTAVAIQQAVADKFNLDPTIRMSNVAEQTRISEYSPERFDENRIADMKNEFRPVIDQMYKDQQDWYKERGIKEVTLYRGIGFEQGQGIPRELSAIKMGEGRNISLKMNPLSPWSVSRDWAEAFALGIPKYHDGEKFLLAAKVPIERIFSNSLVNGVGTSWAGEHAVIGGNMDVKAYHAKFSSMAVDFERKFGGRDFS